MKTFQYKGFDAAGVATRGFVEALTAKAAREKLAAQGVLTEKISATSSQTRFRVDARAIVYRELSALLRAGVPLTRALEILIDSPDSVEYASVLAGVRDRVREGSTLASALSDSSGSVSAYETAIIEAAESTANMAPMLGNVAEFLDEQIRSRERIRSALIYPAFVGVTGLIVATVMLVFLVPKAETLLMNGKVAMPMITQVAMAIGRFALRAGPVILGAVFMGGVIGAHHYRRSPSFRIAVDRQRLLLPVLRKGGEVLVNLRFCRTLAALLEGGVNVVDALPLAARATGNAWIASMSERSTGDLKSGQSLSRTVQDIPPLRERVPGWIAIGEESGELPSLLAAAAERLEDQWQRYLTRSLGLLEPILILVIGAFVLFVTLSILLPVLSLSQAVG